MHRLSVERCLASAAILAAAALTGAAESVWTGGTGTWNKAVNWLPEGVPNGAAAVVRIDGAPASPARVTLDLSPTVGGLTLDAGDTLVVAPNRTLTVYGTAGLTNNGTVAIEAVGTVTVLTFNGDQSLNGAGEVVMTDTTYNRIAMASTAQTLTHAASHTIRGAGNLLYNTGNATNLGAIVAQGANALVLDPSSFFVNAGVLRAEGSGGLTLAAGSFDNVGQPITIMDGSKLTLQNGAFLSGGGIAGAATGPVVPETGARLHGLTLESGTAVWQEGGRSVTVSGGVTNHGQWSMKAVGTTTALTFSGDQALAGEGELVMSDTTYNRIAMASVSQTLTHGAGHTIRGAGNLLYNSGNLTNFGTVAAQGANALLIDPAARFVNAGTVRADGAGGLTLAAGLFENAGQTIQLADGSKITLQNGAVLRGGTVAGAGAGRLVPETGATLEGLALAAGTQVEHANARSVTVAGGLTNRGRWSMNGTGSYTTLLLAGDQTLGGDGELVLADSTYNRLYMVSTAQTLTHAAGHTIRGAGQLLNNTGSMTNRGAVLAQGARALIIDPSAVFVNQGTWRAEGSGGLTLAAGTFENAGQTLDIGNGSVVALQSGAVLRGGTVAAEGSGRLAPETGATLEGVTLAAGTPVSHANGQSVTLTGGLTNRGRWSMNGTGTFTTLLFSGDQTLGGDGEIVLADSTYNRLYLASTAQTLTHAAGHTIRGAGNLLNNSGNLDNYGRILAVGLRSLTVNPATFFRNRPGGVLGGTGTLEFTDGLVDNAGVIAPGLSVGTLTIKGNVSNTATAQYAFELGGTGAGQSDRLNVQGALALDGELHLAFANGFVADPDEEILLITATALSGTFANAVPAEGNTATGVLTGIGTCDVTYDTASSPKTVRVSNIVADPALLQAVSMDAAGPARAVGFAPSSPAWQYTLQYRAALTAGTWSDVPGQGPRPGIGRRDTMVHTNAPAAGFYRVRGEPLP